jgi:hypothetical protein
VMTMSARRQGNTAAIHHHWRHGIPSDSGGPVWQLNSDTSITIVGIWIGEHDRAAGRHNGRLDVKTAVPQQI